MAKFKKSILAAKRSAKKAHQEKPVSNNPFEVHINKRKHDILGRKMKDERGMPGVSRSKAIKKRQKTLLAEYKQKNKANIFVDKRFGENDIEMSLEDKLMQRFTVEKQRHHEKSGMFNLEEEELTHFGHSLGDIHKFDDVRLSDNEDQEDDQLVQDSHFGGFLKKIPLRQEGNQDNEEVKHRSRKEIMEEVVAKAKLKKHERQAAKEEVSDLTDTLDQDWKDVQSLMSFRDPHDKPDAKADDYDIAVKQLAYEMKGKATNRLKTDEQIAKEEQERLAKLEADRIRRMKGLPLEDDKPKHLSADDLGDSFSIPEDDRMMLSYSDGKVNLPEGEENLEYEFLGNHDNEKESGDDDSDNDDDDDDDDDDDSSEDEEGEDNMGGEDEGDLASDQESIEETDQPEELVKSQKDKKSVSSSKKESVTQKSKKELPFTFKAPNTYEEFNKLISKWSKDDELTIIERIKACNHPKLLPENKGKMETFFSILLEYMRELLQANPPEIVTVDKLTMHLFDIAQHSPVNTSKCMQGVLKMAHEKYTSQAELKGGRGVFPGLETLMFFPLVTVLFPTSDRVHSVCTPAMIFMAKLLTQSQVHSLSDVLKGLFVCNIFLEFVAISKRFVPEVINFLCGVCFLASEKIGKTPQLIMPFKGNSKWKDLLKVKPDENARSVNECKFNLVDVLSDNNQVDLQNTQTRANILWMALQLIKKFSELYKDLPAFKEIFTPVKAHLERIPIELYPDNVKELQESVSAFIISRGSVPRRHLTLQTRKPQPIKTYEPKFEEHYEIKSRKNQGSKKANELQKLKYKFKREFKGAIREVRKDGQFLARQKLQEQMERDAERTRKVKRIEHFLSNQQAETNEMNRKKRRLKSRS